MFVFAHHGNDAAVFHLRGFPNAIILLTWLQGAIALLYFLILWVHKRSSKHKGRQIMKLIYQNAFPRMTSVAIRLKSTCCFYFEAKRQKRSTTHHTRSPPNFSGATARANDDHDGDECMHYQGWKLISTHSDRDERLSIKIHYNLFSRSQNEYWFK